MRFYELEMFPADPILIGEDACDALQEELGIARHSPDFSADFHHLRFEISIPVIHGPPPAGGVALKSGLKTAVMKELKSIVEAIADDVVNDVNHAQVLRIIRESRNGC
jgi:hypothetical protein